MRYAPPRPFPIRCSRLLDYDFTSERRDAASKRHIRALKRLKDIAVDMEGEGAALGIDLVQPASIGERPGVRVAGEPDTLDVVLTHRRLAVGEERPLGLGGTQGVRTVLRFDLGALRPLGTLGVLDESFDAGPSLGPRTRLVLTYE